MTKFEEYEKQFYAMIKNEDLSIVHKLNGLDFLIFEMTKLINNNELSQEELARSLELSLVYEDFIIKSKISNLIKRREWLLSIKTLQDDYLDTLNSSKSELEKQTCVKGLNDLHKLSSDIEGDIEQIDKDISKMELEYFDFKSSRC